MENFSAVGRRLTSRVAAGLAVNVCLMGVSFAAAEPASPSVKKSLSTVEVVTKAEEALLAAPENMVLYIDWVEAMDTWARADGFDVWQIGEAFLKEQVHPLFPRSHPDLGLGLILLKIERYDEAIGLLRPVFESAPNRAIAAMVFAQVFILGKRPDLGIQYFERRVAHRPSGGAWYGLAILHEKRRPLEAVEAYRQAAEAFRAAGELDSQAHALNDEGIVHLRLGDLSKAKERFEEALAIREGLEESKGILHVLNNLVRIEHQRGRYVEAIRLNERTLALQEKLGDRKDAALSCANVGVAYTNLGDLERALAYQRRAVESFRALGELPNAASTLNMMGMAYKSLGDFERARRVHREALRLYESSGEPWGVAHTLASLGSFHAAWGGTERAEEYYLSSLRAAERLGDRSSEALVYGQLGRLALKRGDPEEAERRFRDALDIAEALGNKRDAEASLRGIFSALAVRGDADAEEMSALAGRAEAMARETRNSQALVSALQNRAFLERKQGDRDAAFRSSQEALALAQRIRALDSARISHHLLGELALGESGLARPTDPWRVRQDKLDGLAASSGPGGGRSGNFSEAAAHYRAALKISESTAGLLEGVQERGYFLPSCLSSYEALAETLVALCPAAPAARETPVLHGAAEGGKALLKEAFEAVERRKARALRDELGPFLSTPRALPEALLEKRLLLEARLRWLRQALRDEVAASSVGAGESPPPEP
ncbi:MAG: tetratricopeptide repeat protein [Acidobacteriota bacterium]|nr:MAG: tetratricopeptide repeat protein [Acidobacteriota bacterium]